MHTNTLFSILALPRVETIVYVDFYLPRFFLLIKDFYIYTFNNNANHNEAWDPDVLSQNVVGIAIMKVLNYLEGGS